MSTMDVSEWTGTDADSLPGDDSGPSNDAGRLLPLVYDYLRERARQLMAMERADHTLTATALVHESYLKLAGRRNRFEDRRHFFNAAAQAMRQILVDHARTKRRDKRGGADGRARMQPLDALDTLCAEPTATDLDWEAMERALDGLKARDERRYQVVMLRFFAGCSEAEIAALV